VDEALSAGQSSKSSKGKGKKNPDITCWNCDEKGHISRHCKKPKKPKKGDSDGKKGDGKTASSSGTANTVEAGLDSEDEGAWAAIEVEGEELDWFELVIAEMEGKGEEGVVEEFRDTSGHVLIATEAADLRGTTELYDSGCTNHISPYRQKFENFVRIPPRVFRTANQQNFSAIGKGDLLIDVPDGDDYSRLWLRNILFSSDVAYTLVSIG